MDVSSRATSSKIDTQGSPRRGRSEFLNIPICPMPSRHCLAINPLFLFPSLLPPRVKCLKDFFLAELMIKERINVYFMLWLDLQAMYRSQTASALAVL